MLWLKAVEVTGVFLHEVPVPEPAIVERLDSLGELPDRQLLTTRKNSRKFVWFDLVLAKIEEIVHQCSPWKAAIGVAKTVEQRQVLF